MANNRLYIRCKTCGDVFCIGKHFNDPLKVPYYFDTELSGMKFVYALNEFFAEHFYCTNNENGDVGPMYSLELCEEFPGWMTDSETEAF